MDDSTHHDRLSRIRTHWTLLRQAHEGEEDAATRAQAALLERYSAAIYRYLLGALRDPEAAQDFSQDFALKFIQGAFRRADPDRGRFRDFVKTSLYHLIVDHQRGRARGPRGLAEESQVGDERTPPPDYDQHFNDRWREELLNRTWDELAQPPGADRAALSYRAPLPCRASRGPAPGMAEALGAELGKPLTPGGVRQTLHRAREKFADLLLEEVAHSLQSSDARKLEQELIDLGLLAYCRSAVERRLRE